MHAMAIDPEQQAQLIGYFNGADLADDASEKAAARAEFKQASLKDQQRDDIQSQVEKFLAKGGSIKSCTSEDNHDAKRPIRMTRAQQVAYSKKYLKAK